MSNVVLNILSEFKGKKAFKEADTAIAKLGKSVKGLALGFGAVYGARGIAGYFKAAAKSAAADQVSTQKLANAVKNLGMEYANPYIQDYISKLEQQSKIADDQLRPAFQTLIQQTGSLAKSQELLATAITVSRGSGEDLATVTNDLSQAYVGNTKGLKKYALGLTNAQLAAAKFKDIQKLLNLQYSGASAAYLNTYQGQIDTVALAFDNLQESAGRAFFTLLGGSGGGAGGASFFGRFIEGVGIGLEKSAQAISDFFVRQTMSQNAFDEYIRKRNAAPAPTPGKELFLKSSVNNNAALKLEKARLDLIKKQLAENKKQEALKKAGTIFDKEQINLVAGLKRDLSEADRKRAELQLALATENVKEAQRLVYEIAKAQGLGEQMARNLATLPDAKNPFEAWKDYLDKIETQVDRIASQSLLGGVGTDSSRSKDMITVPVVPDLGGGAGTGGAPVTVNITALGQITTQQDITEAIRNGLLDAGMSGLQVAQVRRLGSFGG